MAHSKESTEAWNAILRHVDIARVDPEFDKQLWRLVLAFGKTQLPTHTSPAGGSSGAARSGMVMRFGNSKGVALEDLQTKDLDWYIGAAERSIADPSKANYKDKNQAELTQLRAERARR